MTDKKAERVHNERREKDNRDAAKRREQEQRKIDRREGGSG